MSVSEEGDSGSNLSAGRFAFRKAEDENSKAVIPKQKLTQVNPLD